MYVYLVVHYIRALYVAQSAYVDDLLKIYLSYS